MSHPLNHGVRPAALLCVLIMAGAVRGADRPVEPLPGTAPLEWTDDISVRIVDEAHRLLDRKTAESVAAREKLWKRDLSSPAAYEKSVEPNRLRLRKILGVVEPRVPVVMERFGDEDNPALVAQTQGYRVWQVRWTVLDGLTGEGLLLEPIRRASVPACSGTSEQSEADSSTRREGDSPIFVERKLGQSPAKGSSTRREGDSPIFVERKLGQSPERKLGQSPERKLGQSPERKLGQSPAKGHVVVIPDADQTPEQLAGLAPGVAAESQSARRLAENGFRVVVPVLVSRSCEFSGNPQVRMTNQPHREWIYRQAFEMGRHVIGYEVQKVLAAVDWLDRTGGPDASIGVAGYAEGGLIALGAAAVDPRIKSCLASGYFGPRERLWEEPIYRNVWRLLAEFGDAEIATLVAPRGLVIEHSPVPAVEGPPAVKPGRAGGAAPGRLATPAGDAVVAEIRRAEKLLAGKLPGPVALVAADRGPQGPGGKQAVERFVRELAGASQSGELPISNVLPQDARRKLDVEGRQHRQVEELSRHVQRIERTADRARDEFFLKKAYGKGPEAFVEASNTYREVFRREVIGWIDDPLAAPAPKTRKVYDEPTWTGYEVVLDTWPDLHAWGILCLPKDIRPGERRPAVVCQHGLEGVPRDTVERGVPGFQYYKAFTAELAGRGYVTFAPFNLYRGGDRFRSLQRKANPLGLSLFSIITRQHEQIVRWLGTLPQVDRSRIAFYGLSYGGKTAMRVPPLVDGYCLSICSGDFNDWVRKNASVDFPGSYMFTGEYEIFEWDLGHTFNYAEMAYLVFPRPFMVERGHHDGVGVDSWVAYEYAKVRWLYANLGLGNKTEIEFFNGPHAINGVGTYGFLGRQLNWKRGR